MLIGNNKGSTAIARVRAEMLKTMMREATPTSAIHEQDPLFNQRAK
jgi:hypothetical protein